MYCIRIAVEGVARCVHARMPAVKNDDIKPAKIMHSMQLIITVGAAIESRGWCSVAKLVS